MPYIPKEHLKYNILPNASKGNWEVFEYPDTLEELVRLTNNELNYPYNYKSYQQYYDELDSIIFRYPKYKKELMEFKKKMIEMNDKSKWGIVKYIGNSNSYFIKGRYYYCPIYNGKCSGIIDEEEFTSYCGFDFKEDDIGSKFKEAFEIEIDYNTTVKNFFGK